MNLIIIRFGKIVKPFLKKITHFEKIRISTDRPPQTPVSDGQHKIVESMDDSGIVCGKADAAAL